MNLLSVFSPSAVENIQRTGNVWGHTTEYDFKFSVKIWRREIKFEQKSASNPWGRFGGGWSFKIGVQAGSFKSFIMMNDVIVSLFTISIRCSAVK